jgi:hypothetical protein
MAIRTSRFFRLVDGQWRQQHHHGSIDDPALLAAYQAAVGVAPAPRTAWRTGRSDSTSCATTCTRS